jgi:hypothetical protein
MIYTATGGIDYKREHLESNLLKLLPIAAAFLIALFGYFAHRNNMDQISTGKSLNIYTAAANDLTSGSGSGNNVNPQNNGSNAQSPSTSPAASPQSTAAGPLATDVSTSSSNQTPTVIGGRGGGSGDTGGSGGGSGTGSSTPAGTVACGTNTGVLPVTCNVCTNQLVVAGGFKAVFSSDGTCTMVN